MKQVNTKNVPAKVVDVQVTPKGFTAINAPKMNNETKAALALAEMVYNYKPVFERGHELTPFGHQLNKLGGQCDMAILKGHVNSAFGLLYYVASQKHVANVAALYEQYNVKGKGVNMAAVMAHIARRESGHIKWCSNPENMAHGGFISRLQKTGLAAAKNDDMHKYIASLFKIINDGLPLYNNEAKAALALERASKKLYL